MLMLCPKVVQIGLLAAMRVSCSHLKLVFLLFLLLLLLLVLAHWCLVCSYWIGQCAGTEWLARFLPLWLADWLLYRAMGLAATEPVLLSNAAALAQAGTAASASGKKSR